MKNCTVSRTGDHWYVSIQTEVEVDEPVHQSQSSVGIDVGVTKFATLSDGTVYEPLNIFRKMQKKLGKAQRKLAAKAKGSNNWVKQKRKVTRLHRKIANIRQDYLHKVSTEISQNHAIIVVEDLQVANLSKSASGTAQKPGRRVAQKSGLNKSILDQGWRQFRKMLEYKQLWRGGIVMAIPPPNMSITCAACGWIDRASRPSQSQFSCVHCGHSENADVNAAQNILASGLGESQNACEAA